MLGHVATPVVARPAFSRIRWQPRSPATVSPMMSPDWRAPSARYNRWMNDKIYGIAATLSDAARKRDEAHVFKSIHGTDHSCCADRVWLGRFKAEPPRTNSWAPRHPLPRPRALRDFEELRLGGTSADRWRAYEAGSRSNHEHLAARSCICAAAKAGISAVVGGRPSPTIKPSSRPGHDPAHAAGLRFPALPISSQCCARKSAHLRHVIRQRRCFVWHAFNQAPLCR